MKFSGGVSLICQSKKCILAVVVAFGAYKTLKYLDWLSKRKKWDSVPKDVVVLHMLPRGKTAPNISPFPLKLETYLRMADISYEVDFSEPMGPKEKTPWITLNREDMGDSQLIMEYLGRKYEKDFSARLTPEQHAIGRAMRVMLEEHVVWGLALWRYVFDGCESLPAVIKWPLPFRVYFKYVIAPKMETAAWYQGIGRHSQAEIRAMMTKHIRAVSDYLDELTNLQEYCYRMKDRFWPDWEKCLDV